MRSKEWAEWWARLSPLQKWLALAWGKPSEVAVGNVRQVRQNVEARKRLRVR
jgi:hypothetical protein